MLKFTHQLITESTYKLMLEKQRKEIHLAIAEEYESCSAKFESEVLAYHWLRSGMSLVVVLCWNFQRRKQLK